MLNLKPLYYSHKSLAHKKSEKQYNNLDLLSLILRINFCIDSPTVEGDGVQLMSKAEIDTTAPFRSVKEAVMLFGERVLCSEVYGSKLKEMQDGTMIIEYDHETVTSDELEETKQSLQRARGESMQMSTSLFFLQQELEQTKMELQQLKSHHESDQNRQPQLDLKDIEDIKFVEDSTGLMKQVVKTETMTQKVEFQKKKYVTFANPPCVAQVVLPNPPVAAEAVLQRNPSLMKKKMKQFIPLIKGIFSKKRGSPEVALA